MCPEDEQQSGYSRCKFRLQSFRGGYNCLAQLNVKCIFPLAAGVQVSGKKVVIETLSRRRVGDTQVVES